ncbi:MAG: type II toxin-antitoxin system HigB family toxin [bacterium]
MEIVGQERLEKFARRHAAARKPVRQWLDVAEAATWQRPADIRRHFNSADFLDGNRVIFNLGGHHYRLVVVAIYAVGKLNVRWIGTHAEYRKLKF